MAERDPIKVHARDARAQRRAGVGWECPSCHEEQRGFAKTGFVCFKCDRIAQGREPYEDNHIFGKRNSDAQIQVPINDHRAELSVSQYSWPPETLANPDGCPLREAAARLRGRADILQYILDDSRASAERLEQLCGPACQYHVAKGAQRARATNKGPKIPVIAKRRKKRGR